MIILNKWIYFFHHFIHSYHDRHQATHSPFYYGAQQDQGRESGYWTVPGSRTGGGLQDYTNWTDPELSAPTSSHFPFILDHHTRQHQGPGEYQQHEARSREWTAAERAAREYEGGFLREGWQRRWEPSNPVRYNREVSTKRSDSSYRELEAWAARYSHSLPRRRHREAESRGTSQVMLESSRAPERRSGTDPQVAVLQQVRQSAGIRESGAWDRGGRQQTPTYYPPQAPAPDTSHVLDRKEKAGYQRRMFSQPPGYIAPPPYNSPHKSSPVIHHCDHGYGQEGKQQHYWSQPTLRQQDACVDVQDKRKVGKEDFKKPNVNEICAELEGLEHRGPGPDAAHMQRECMSSLQQPQLIQAVQDTKTNEQTSSKVIEGRKFRLNKKTGGLTIFCLVSRIVSATETPSLPLCTSQANIQSPGFGEGLKDHRDNGDIYQTQKLADEVDFRVPTLTEQSNTSDGRNVQAEHKTTSTCIESEMFSDNLSKKIETGENNNLNDANSTFGRQVTQPVHPVSVKYPLWREPSFTSRAETESSSSVLEANSEVVESDDSYNLGECAPVHPINVEVRRLDIKEDPQSEDSEGLLVIDTTCVVVKMELISSPKKDHVHYLGSTRQAGDRPLDGQSSSSTESNAQLNQDVLPDPLQRKDRAEIELESDSEEKKEPDGGGDTSLPGMSSSPISERETLQERAERILGIPLHDCITEEQQGATSLLDSCVEKCDEEVEPSPVTNDIHDAAEQLLQDTKDEERSQNNLEMDRIEDTVHLKEGDEEEDQVQNEDGKHFAGLQEQVADLSEERDTESQLETVTKKSQEAEMAEESLFERPHEDGTTEQSQAENQPVEKDPSQYLSQCFSPCKDLPNSSQSSTEEGLNPQLAAFDTAENLVPHPETSDAPLQPSPLPPASTESPPSPTPHKCHSPIPPPPDEDEDEEGDTSQAVNDEMSDPEDLRDQQRLECEQTHNAPCVEESNSTDEQQAKEADREITDTLEQCLEISRQNATEVCVEAEECVCVTESHVTEEQQEEKASEDPADILEMTISQENTTASQSQEEVENLQTFDSVGQEDASYGTESYLTAEQPLKDNGEDTDLSVQTSEILQDNMTEGETQVEEEIVQQQCTNVSCVMSPMTEETLQIDEDKEPSISQENATDNQTQAEIEMLQDVEASDFTSPSPSDCRGSQSPLDVLSPSELPPATHASHQSNTEPEPPLEVESAVNPVTADVGIPVTVSPPLQLDSCEESPQLPSSSIDESSQNQASLTSTLPQDGGEDVPFDQPHKALQYPKSLWDAVNRIRKHTAPDSENEEEEVSEHWDPEGTGGELSCLDMVFDMNSGTIVFDNVSTGSFEDVEQDPRHEESSMRAEEDTLSCSSNSSHSSGDTIIVAEEDEIEEMPPDAVTESKTESDTEFPMAEGEPCCSSEVKDETADDDEGEEELFKGDRTELCLSGECTAEVENKTVKAMEVTEMEQKEVEEEGSPPSEVTQADTVQL